MAKYANNLKQLSNCWVKTKSNKPLNRTQSTESSEIDSLHSFISSEPLKLNKIVKKLAILLPYNSFRVMCLLSFAYQINKTLVCSCCDMTVALVRSWILIFFTRNKVDWELWVSPWRTKALKKPKYLRQVVRCNTIRRFP